MFRRISGILACFLCIGLAACSTRVAVETEQPSDTVTDSELPSKAEDISPDSLLSCTITIEGDEFKLPMAYSDVEAMGWVAHGEKDLDEMLNGRNSTSEIYIEKDGLRCATMFVNYSNKAQPMRDCYIYSLWSYYEDCNVENFSLPGGLLSGVATMDDAIALNGQSEYGTDTALVYLYSPADRSINIESIAKFGEDGLLTGFRITHHGPPAGYVQDEIDPNPPEIAANYQAPSIVGEDLKDYIFNMEGKLYKLPCPVSELLDDGWVPEPGMTFDTYPGMAEINIYFWKEGRTISCVAKNFSENTAAFENCMVFGISSQELTEFEVSMDIKVGMKKSAVVEIINKLSLPYEEDKYGYHIYTGTGELNSIPSKLTGYHIDINEDGVVDRIQVYEDTVDED